MKKKSSIAWYVAIFIILSAVAITAYVFVSKKNMAPDVTFTDLNGKQHSLQALRGKVVMVNFWATSCGTCIHEMPKMVELYQKYHGRGLEFVAVAMSYDPPNYVVNYVETRKLPFKVVFDGKGQLAQSFGDVKLTPTTFVIDKDGAVLKRYVGQIEWQALQGLLDKELAT